MGHTQENNIKCPYCDWEDEDSWEFGEDSGTYTCGDCGEEFHVERSIEVTYNTSRIDCNDRNIEHNYQFRDVFERKQRFENGKWISLAESEWTYFKIMRCSICGNDEHVEITKNEYLTLLRGN